LQGNCDGGDSSSDGGCSNSKQPPLQQPQSIYTGVGCFVAVSAYQLGDNASSTAFFANVQGSCATNAPTTPPTTPPPLPVYKLQLTYNTSTAPTKENIRNEIAKALSISVTRIQIKQITRRRRAGTMNIDFTVLPPSSCTAADCGGDVSTDTIKQKIADKPLGSLGTVGTVTIVATTPADDTCDNTKANGACTSAFASAGTDKTKLCAAIPIYKKCIADAGCSNTEPFKGTVKTHEAQFSQHGCSGSSSSKDKGLGGGAIAAIIISVLLVLGLIVGGVMVLKSRGKHNARTVKHGISDIDL